MNRRKRALHIMRQIGTISALAIFSYTSYAVNNAWMGGIAVLLIAVALVESFIEH